MKKIKGTISFIIIFLIILVIDFILYKNLDKLMPTYENKVYSFENEANKKEKDFLFEMFEHIEEIEYKNYRAINDEEFGNINETIYKLVKQGSFEEIEEEELKDIFMDEIYIKELSNTIYGNLKVIRNMYTPFGFMIAYTEDMSKIYYINAVINEQYNKEMSIEMHEFGEDYETGYETEYMKKNKAELINGINKHILKIFKKQEFNPDTIIYKGNYYILKDSVNDMTVYYNANDDIILGLHKGFGV